MVSLLKKLANNKLTIGSWVQIGDPSITKLMIKSGFEWLVLDMEHGTVFERDLPTLLETFNGSECTPLVRVPKNDKSLINRVLDLGAKGVVIPSVSSVDDVRKAIDAIKYPPIGSRGIGFSRANDYGTSFEEYFLLFNDQVLLIIQIENIDAVDSIDEILSISSVDSYIIGPYDLSGSMGLVGEFDHPDYIKTIEKVKKSALEHNIPSGIHIVEPILQELKKCIKAGYVFIAYGTDALLLYNRCRSDLSQISKYLKNKS